MHKYPRYRHFLDGEEFTPEQLNELLAQASNLKRERSPYLSNTTLKGYHLALLFDKPSLRTRFSFTVAMRELGGDVIESIASSRKSETPEDIARVLSQYCHGIVVRTHKDADLFLMSQATATPIINALSDLYHPCQILADLFTLKERFGDLSGLNLCYIGDGNNILHSLMLMAPQMGVNIRYCCPPSRGPDAFTLEKCLNKSQKCIRLPSKLAGAREFGGGSERRTAAYIEVREDLSTEPTNKLPATVEFGKKSIGKIEAFSTPAEAATQAHAVYTDVWTSMGFEAQSAEHLFEGFQVNEKLMERAREGAIFMHCLPMERGKEVSETLPNAQCSVIFQQSENRLHVQKALLIYLLRGDFV